MSIPRIVSAMEYIDDDLVSSAVTYTRQKRKWWTNWKAIAACVAVVAIVFGAIPFLNSNPNAPIGSPFVLTAYATGVDNTVSAVEMKEGENIPVSFFEANNGMRGYVFSYAADDPKQPISVSIINADQQFTVDEKIETISNLEMDSTQRYVFFIPPQNEAGPYSLPLTMHDEETNTVALLKVVIEQAEDGYTARIDSISIFEKRTEPTK